MDENSSPNVTTSSSSLIAIRYSPASWLAISKRDQAATRVLQDFAPADYQPDEHLMEINIEISPSLSACFGISTAEPPEGGCTMADPLNSLMAWKMLARGQTTRA